MLSLGARQTKHGAARGALAIDMRFAVAEFVATQAEESAKPFVFPTALVDLARKGSPKDRHRQRDRHKEIGERQHRVENKEGQDGVENHHAQIYEKQYLIEGIRTVSAVHKTVELILEISHVISPIIRCEEPQRDPS